MLAADVQTGRFRRLTHRAARDELTIPRELWAPPLPEARWAGTPPRLRLLAYVLPIAALVSGYVAAAAAAGGHIAAAGWLLAVAMIAVVGFAGAVVRHFCRAVRYRREAPR